MPNEFTHDGPIKGSLAQLLYIKWLPEDRNPPNAGSHFDAL